MRKEIFILILSVISIGNCADYTNFKVYEVLPTTKEQLKQLLSWENKLGIDFWSHGGVQRPSRVMASPEVQSSFLQFITSIDIKYEMIIDDVKQSLEVDKIAQSKGRSKRSTIENGQANFEIFWDYDQISFYLDQLAIKYPNLVKKEVIGKTIEMRDIIGIRVSKNSEFGVNPIVFIDSGTHSREWAGIQSSLYFLHQLVENSTVSDELLDGVDYVFVNVVNVDGYIYTWEEDRLWRKNRRYVNYTCTGIDLNRNYAYNWRYSPNSCPTNGYSGSGPMSEPEVQAVADYMTSFKHNLRLYLSTHTYGNFVLWPFGFAFNVYIKNHKDHHMLGLRFADAIKNATGTDYRVGNSADILYTANGASDDFAAAYANANFAYTLELTGGGRSGFDFPQDRIYDLVKETFLGYRQFALFIKERFNYNK